MATNTGVETDRVALEFIQTEEEIEDENIKLAIQMPDMKELLRLQNADEFWKNIVLLIKKTRKTKLERDKVQKYVIRDDIEYHRDSEGKSQLCLPKCLIRIVLHNYHNTKWMGHLGHRKSYDKIRKRYFWKKMTRDIHCRSSERPIIGNDFKGVTRENCVSPWTPGKNTIG
ncbi:hypothetical protein AYI69_g10592 [Smittium culicis]|uniref:Integrase zinc-binding domain-containing protein n=1 Tax=Smittium culicis TaxID=133412 RepID=A0A1R1X4P1_9FUNG|nr:hypothetical protein AYI69_g10592 [Smittium culicis]